MSDPTPSPRDPAAPAEPDAVPAPDAPTPTPDAPPPPTGPGTPTPDVPAPTPDAPTAPTPDVPAPAPTVPDVAPTPMGTAVPEGFYTADGVPTFDAVREKIEGRYSTSVGAQELDADSAAGQTFQEQWDAREKASRERLEQLRASIRGDQG